eukprot:403246_1
MAHQTYIQMVYEAISNSNKYEQSRIGISRQRIAAYIKQNHSDSISSGATFNTHLRKALRKGIEQGTLTHGDNKMRFKLKLKEKKKNAKNKKTTKKKKKKTKQKKKKQKENTPPKSEEDDNELSEDNSEFKEDCCCECGSENDLIQCRSCSDYICEQCLGHDHWSAHPPLDVCSGCFQSNNNWK